MTDSRFLGGGGGEGERGGDSASSSAVSESESGGRNSSRSCRRRSLSLSVLGEREEMTLIVYIISTSAQFAMNKNFGNEEIVRHL